MANLVSVENVSKSFGLKTLLDGVSLGVQTGDRIGVVGLNGGGKSTLLKVLTGQEQPDEGRVSQMNDIRVAMVTQEANLNPEDTVADVVLKPLGVETFEWASKSSVRDVLDGLGITELGLDSKVGQLSGGERRRTNLAAALVQELDLLVLDEPTNHLDVEGVQWLADYLLKTKAALVVVTHDRWFLDTVATRTWEVHDGRVDTYEGGYNDWVYARAERARQADAVEQRRRNLARKELAWLRRGAPARTSKPRYRIEAAEALIADVPAPRDTVELMAFSKQRQGKVVIELEDAYIATPDGRDLVRDLAAEIEWAKVTMVRPAVYAERARAARLGARPDLEARPRRTHRPRGRQWLWQNYLVARAGRGIRPRYGPPPRRENRAARVVAPGTRRPRPHHAASRCRGIRRLLRTVRKEGTQRLPAGGAIGFFRETPAHARR